MSRLANIEKAGFFEIPPAVTDLVLTYISAPHGGRVLDPCAGEGVALVTLAGKLNLEPFGVEINSERADKAKDAVRRLFLRRLTESRSAQISRQTRILHDSYLSLVTPRDSYNLLYLNSPYDHDSEDGRLEYQWLWRTRPYLQPGGLLIWVVPQHLLKFRKAAAYLLAHYEELQIFRFPDGEYERFRQIILFGLRRARAITPDSADVDRLRLLSMGPESLPPLAAPSTSSGQAASEPVYTLPRPVVPHGRFHFRSQFVDPADALAEARSVGVASTAAWQQHLNPAAVSVPLKPLTPLKIGHMNSIIAAGHLNNQVLADPDNPEERLLIKGRSYKTIREEQFEEPLPGGETKITSLETEVVVTDITTIDGRGAVTYHNGPQLEAFLSRWIGPLTAIVAQAYTPVYRFDLNGYGRVLNSLSLEREIPGLDGQVGLLPAQKHAAAAVLTRLEKHPDAQIIGEMGTGKTLLGVAIAAGLKAQRTIILCPPHLVEKWQREAKIVWPEVVTMKLETLSDVDRFFTERRDDHFDNGRLPSALSTARPLIGVLRQTSARSASGWEHAYDYLGPATHNHGSKGFTHVRRWWGAAMSPAALAAGAAEEGPPALDPSLLKRPFSARQLQAILERGIRCPQCGAQQQINGRPLAPAELKSARRFCDNPACRSPLFQFTRRRHTQPDGGRREGFNLYAERERAVRHLLKQGRAVPFQELTYWSGSRLKDTFGYAKVPLAGYIKKRARGRLDLLIGDELHQYKAADSDQGLAMHHLVQAARKVVGLTGTIYGGRASTLFHLLYRTAPDMVTAYTDPNASGTRRQRERDWISAYGILQRIETRKLDENGKETGNSRSNVRYKELPGGSPAMLPWLLNRSVFLSLGDMGFPLPPYEEIPVEVAMAPEQAVLYETLEAQLKEELQERLVRGDKSLLAGYLHALLFWPDSPRRGKVVTCSRTGHVVASIGCLPDEFMGPKERQIIDLCRQEKAAGRKVLLLCMQTDTLDIQPEWQRMLGEAGLKAAVLRAEPAKREAWVEKQVQAGIDVLISHPKKVETGLDLLDFPTIVWMSPHYSVYTVLQASRRSWRIGQTEPVKVYYFAYAETIQNDALYLVAAKVAAALRVNGDTIPDDSLAELDELSGDDIIATLARIVAGESRIEARSLQQAFAEANESIRQDNALIGDYRMVDETPVRRREPVKALAAPMPDAGSFSGPARPLPLFGPAPAVNGSHANGHAADPAERAGRSSMTAQPGDEQPAPNGTQGKGKAPAVNGSQPVSANGRDTAGETAAPKAAPPPPRPRLLL